jgi:hypothetical protein
VTLQKPKLKLPVNLLPKLQLLVNFINGIKEDMYMITTPCPNNKWLNV